MEMRIVIGSTEACHYPDNGSLAPLVLEARQRTHFTSLSEFGEVLPHDTAKILCIDNQT